MTEILIKVDDNVSNEKKRQIIVALKEIQKLATSVEITIDTKNMSVASIISQLKDIQP